MIENLSEKEKIFDEILHERMSQDEEHGGPAHDDTHRTADWTAFIHDHANRADLTPSSARYRYELIRIAATAIAAIESFDRKFPQAIL
jgi:hypothetical protein